MDKQVGSEAWEPLRHQDTSLGRDRESLHPAEHGEGPWWPGQRFVWGNWHALDLFLSRNDGTTFPCCFPG